MHMDTRNRCSKSSSATFFGVVAKFGDVSLLRHRIIVETATMNHGMALLQNIKTHMSCNEWHSS